MPSPIATRAYRARQNDRYLTASAAIHQARYSLTPPRHGFLLGLSVGGPPVGGTVNGFDVTVSVEVDSLSTIGEDDVTGHFTDVESETTVRNGYGRGDSLRFYEPSTVRRAETIADYSARGMPKASARLEMLRAVERDMIEDRNRCYVGVTVEVSLLGRELATESLWGIDDSGTAHLREVAADLIGQALNSADFPF